MKTIIVKKTIYQSDLDFNLPILGQVEYLLTKSDEYGWFYTNNYAIAFFIDKRLIFKRLVFTTGVICKDKNEQTQLTEKEFLNKLIIYVKKYKICDFIYKAQSNVVFKTCPQNAICVPWGTYQVDLKKSKDELFASFNSKSRNVIRKALKSGVIVEKTNDHTVIYENIKSTLVRQNSLHYPSSEYLKKIKEIEGNSAFFIVQKNGIIQGSLVLLYDTYRGYAMYAGSIPHPITGSLDLLHYEAMKFLQNKGVKLYDFVGTRIHIKKGSKQEGIDRFKRKFNPSLVKGYSFKVIINPFKYALYMIFSGLYMKLHGISYKDPIDEISQDEEYYTTLLMGPCFNKKDSSLVSGTIILFEDLIAQYEKHKLSFKVVDTNKANYSFYYFGYLYIIYYFLQEARYSQKILLNSSKDYLLLAPVFFIYTKLQRKKLFLRKFGGDARENFLKAHFMLKYYYKYLYSKFDTLFFETKYLVDFFSKYNSHTFWFPNVRYKTIEYKSRQYHKKFIFLSHVIETKGINEILEVAKKLGTSYTIDIYGPILDIKYNELTFSGHENLHYKGAVEPFNVINVLKNYDVVLLPSYKEGYPGVILEAYSLGIPVITTNLESIKEIVDDYITGILINPKNVEELYDAIYYFNRENYGEFSKNAYKKFDLFDSNKVFKEFLNIIDGNSNEKN